MEPEDATCPHCGKSDVAISSVHLKELEVTQNLGELI